MFEVDASYAADSVTIAFKGDLGYAQVNLRPRHETGEST